MTAGHLLAAPDRIVTNLVPILEEHAITCEVEYTKECDHDRYVIDLTSLMCKSGKAQIGMGIEKRRDRKGVDIVLAPMGSIEAAKKEYYAISDRSLKEGFEREKKRLRQERNEGLDCWISRCRDFFKLPR